MEKITLEGVRNLKAYGKNNPNAKVITGEAYIRLNNAKKYGSLTANMFYEMKAENKKHYTVEEALLWAKEEKEIEGTAAKGWIFVFQVV